METLAKRHRSLAKLVTGNVHSVDVFERENNQDLVVLCCLGNIGNKGHWDGIKTFIFVVGIGCLKMLCFDWNVMIEKARALLTSIKQAREKKTEW